MHTGWYILVQTSSPAERAALPIGTKSLVALPQTRMQERTIKPGIQRLYHRHSYTCTVRDRVASITLPGYEEQDVGKRLGGSPLGTYEARYVTV